MPTSVEIREVALSLARQGIEPEEGASRLLAESPRRIPVVMAKRELEEEMHGGGYEVDLPVAVKILETALSQGNWAE